MARHKMACSQSHSSSEIMDQVIVKKDDTPVRTVDRAETVCEWYAPFSVLHPIPVPASIFFNSPPLITKISSGKQYSRSDTLLRHVKQNICDYGDARAIFAPRPADQPPHLAQHAPRHHHSHSADLSSDSSSSSFDGEYDDDYEMDHIDSHPHHHHHKRAREEDDDEDDDDEDVPLSTLHPNKRRRSSGATAVDRSDSHSMGSATPPNISVGNGVGGERRKKMVMDEDESEGETVISTGTKSSSRTTHTTQPFA